MRRKNKLIVIGVSGCSGSGKSTLANLLVETFAKQGKKSLVISQDNYYKPKTELLSIQNVDEVSALNFDLPSCIDFDCIKKAISQLRSGKNADQQKFSFKDDAPVVVGKINPNDYDIIIVEGIFTLCDEIRPIFDFTVFVSTELVLCAERRFARDQQERNLSKDRNESMWHQKVLPGYYKYIRPSIKFADFTISNNYALNIQNLVSRFEMKKTNVSTVRSSFFYDHNNRFNCLQNMTRMRNDHRSYRHSKV